jgi:plasmid stability protein
MAKTNLTLQLDEDVIRRARVVAAKRGTSVSALVAHELTELVAQDTRYEQARLRAEELMAKAKPRGGRTWTRDDIYAERLDRHGRG